MGNSNATQALQKNAKRGITSKDKYSTIQDAVERNKAAITKVLPKHISPERLMKILTTEARRNPKLLDCSVESFIGAAITSAQVGLEPGPLGHAYLIPRWNKHTEKMEVNFQIGYKGYVDLCRRSGEVAKIEGHRVYERDHFEYAYGSRGRLEHEPYMGEDRGKVICYYVFIKLTCGEEMFQVLSLTDIEKIRKRSKFPNAGAWKSDYDKMALKSVVNYMKNMLPLNTDEARAAMADNTVRTEIEGEIEEVAKPDVDDKFIDADYTVMPESAPVVVGDDEGPPDDYVPAEPEVEF